MHVSRCVLPALFFAAAMLSLLIAPSGAQAQSFYPVSPEMQEAPQPPQQSGRVIVLHGIGRTSLSMIPIKDKLERAGYEVFNLGYHSTRDTLATIVRDFIKKHDKKLDSEESPLHFVCYSLGCLVTRGVIEQHRPKMLGRVVMLGPPNQGSEMADFLAESEISRFLWGPNLPQLGTANRHNLHKLIGNSVDYETGVIAGNRALDPVGPAIIPGSDDGRVAVDNTKITGMKAHIVVGTSHTGLLTSDVVHHEMLFFLAHGDFRYE